MAEDHIRYDILAQAALRGVVRTVLADVAKKGLPGEHHFKITFATGAPGVQLSDRMRAQYPQVMTIVLQHQFWDLEVREEAFDVGLSFGGIPERLTVPFEAVTGFFDPAVQFGLQFETVEAGAETSGEAKAPATGADKPGVKPDLPAPSRPDEVKRADAVPAPVRPQEAPSGTGEVVSLDRFRKK
jgi:uncharacterized protein